MRQRLWIAAALVVALGTAAAVLPGRLTSFVETVHPAREPMPGWGFTHTQFSADDGDGAAVRAVQKSLSSQPLVQAQHIMGWGAGNPEPSPGVYDFASLDRRMGFIERSGGTPVIVLCCAPDWMKGGAPGETDWDRLTEAPSPQHYADFAALSATIAKRYPAVRHFLVWNEFKGFFDDQRNRWDAETYTELYNMVYDAVKAVDPSNRIGGPYLDMASEPRGSPDGSAVLTGPWGAADQRVLEAFDHWLEHKHGADFVVVDGHATTQDGGDDEFAALSKFSAVNGWIRERTNLPIWWAEWYVQPTDDAWSPAHVRALRAAAMIELAGSGAQTVLYWNPRPGGSHCAACLWTDTWAKGGGQPLPFLTDVLQPFARWFPPGTEVRPVQVSPELRALASDRALVVVNTSDQEVTARIEGRTMTLDAYETRWMPSV